MSPADGSDRPDPSTVVRPSGDKGAPAPGAGALGMTIFLVSLGVLFAGSLVAYVVIRLRAETWRPPDAPGLPVGLWISTALLLGCSAGSHLALIDIRRGLQRRLLRDLSITLVLALAFVASQGWSWIEFHRTDLLYRNSLFGFTFYMLTGLHALHVLGGLIGLVVVLVRACGGAYCWAYYPGVRNSAVYWHFLDGVWLVLFGVLLFG